MGEIVLFPTHKDYCGKCEYRGMMGESTNEKYLQNMYKVCCMAQMSIQKGENA